MSEVRLQVKNLCKSFGITKAVQNVSFNVNKGEVSRNPFRVSPWV